MPDTRRAMHAITEDGADPDLVASMLSAVSDADATISFTLLRESIPDEHLLALANLRELLFELPQAPFRVGEELGILAPAAGYEDTGHSYRRLFESSHGVFGLEFMGRARNCDGIFVHTPGSRMQLGPDGDYRLDAEMIVLFIHHRIVLDALLEALELLGLPLCPTFYVSVDDYLAEHCAAAASEAFGELF
jgi:hypothetical protein